MFIQVAVVLAGAETTILLLDEEEWGCLRGVQGTNLSAVKVFLEEIFSGFTFTGRERVNFPNFGSEGVVKVDLMIIGSRRRDMVGGFFGEDQSEVGEFGGKGLLRFHFFSSCGKFSSGGDLGYLLF